MIPTRLLVPTFNNDGRPFSAQQLREIEGRLLDSFGGWSRTVDVVGNWKDDDGRVYRDRLREYGIALTSWRDIQSFLEIADWVCRVCRQESVYIEVAGIPEILGPPA